MLRHVAYSKLPQVRNLAEVYIAASWLYIYILMA